MIVFSSYGFRTPVLQTKLRGRIDPAGKSVLLIPFAGVNEAGAAARETEGLCAFGFDRQRIIVAEEGMDISFADVIYVPGGRTFRLLRRLRECGLCEAVRKAVLSGATYIGVSAGAAAATRDMEYVTMFEDNDEIVGGGFSALAITDKTVIPHADSFSREHIAECRMLYCPDRDKYITVNNDEAVMLTENGFVYL